MMVQTSSSYVLNCERILWSVRPDGNRTAYLKDANGCCRRVDKFDSSNSDYFEQDITPTTKCTNLKSTERVSKKLIKIAKSDTNLCLFIYICHPSRDGILVTCRKEPEPSLVDTILETVDDLVNLVLPINLYKMKTIKQTECVFANNCFF